VTAVLYLLVAVVPAGWLAQTLAEAHTDSRLERQVAACSRRAAGRPGERRTASPWPVANLGAAAVVCLWVVGLAAEAGL
jgi:hypothetical protein